MDDKPLLGIKPRTLFKGWSNALDAKKVAGNQGRAVGKTIAEGKGQPFVKVPVFWSARKFG